MNPARLVVALVGLAFALLGLLVAAVTLLGKTQPSSQFTAAQQQSSFSSDATSDSAATFDTEPDTTEADTTAPASTSPTTASDTNTLAALLRTPAPSDGTVIDEETAGKILGQVWDARLDALSTQDNAALATFETGVQLEADQNTCFCDPPPGTRIQSWAVSATRDASYPQHFLAQATSTTAGMPGVNLMMFVRAAAGEPWMLEEMVGYTPNTPGDLVLKPSPSPQLLNADPASLPESTADAENAKSTMNAYWTYWATNGTEQPGTYLGGGGALTDLGAGTARKQASVRSSGIQLTYDYTDASPAVLARLPGTTRPLSAVVCGGTSYVSTYAPLQPNGVVTFPEGVEALLPPDLVTPGTYKKVVVDGYRSWCLNISADRHVWAYIGFTGRRLVQATR